MSSVDSVREFVQERLTAAAEEIFGVFARTIGEYEEEINRQRRLLDIVWKPEIKLHRIELPQQHVCKEKEDLTDQQLCIQERNSRPDQEDPEPPRIKDEQEELCVNQQGEPLAVKQETDSFVLNIITQTQNVVEDKPLNHISVETAVMPETIKRRRLLLKNSEKRPKHQDLGSTKNIDPKGNQQGELLAVKQETPTHEESDHSEDQTLCLNPDETYSSEESAVVLPVTSSVYDETSDHQLPTGDQEEPKQQKIHCKTEIHMNSLRKQDLSEDNCNTEQCKKSFKCDTCGNVFKLKSLWKRHQRIHTGEKPSICHTQSQTCDIVFRQSGRLTTSVTSPTDEEQYICKTCGKQLADGSAFKTHMRIHTGEKPFECKICGIVFRHNSNLTVHMRSHTGEKPYLCTTCDKKFADGSALKRHLRIHTDEKPFACKMCGMVFRQSSNLTVHMRSHTGSHKGKMPYSCKICRKTFSGLTACKTHMRIHTGEMPFTCETCGRRFRCKSSLRIHMRTHTGEKPFTCNICGSVFAQRGNLTTHLRTHTGERPYSCKTCDKRFADNSSCKRHMRIHTSKKPPKL